MNKKELIRKVAEETGCTQKECAKILNTLLQIASHELSQDNGEVLLTGFGSLRTRKRAPRMGVSPKTGAPMEIPGGRTVLFKSGTALQALLDNSSDTAPEIR